MDTVSWNFVWSQIFGRI